jgi:hypothetical protein
MGKMALFCTAHHAGKPSRLISFSRGSFLRDLPRAIYAVRWAFAAAAFSIAVAMLLAMGYQRVQGQYLLPARPAIRVEPNGHFVDAVPSGAAVSSMGPFAHASAIGHNRSTVSMPIPDHLAGPG